MWQPDGWGFRARLGLLVPHAAIGSESELAAMVPAGVSIHAARVPLGGMRALGPHRVALVDPPWFSPELTALGVDYFAGQGFAIAHAASAGVPSEQRAINPGQLFEWARKHVPAEADAVYIGGNGLPAVGIIQGLEGDPRGPR